MKSLVVRVLLAVMSVTFASQAFAALYATGGGVGELSGLYIVDPLNGAAALAWNFPGIHIYAGGLAYDTTTNTLYATGAQDSSTGTSRLFIIDRFTGAATPLAGLPSNINLTSGGLAISPITGVMYATGGYSDLNPHQSTALFTIDKGTGAATLVGFAGGNCCSGDFGIMLNGLGFRSDGTLFANGWALGGPSYPDPSDSHLYTVDLATGAANHIGPTGVTLGRSLKYSGLAFRADGTLLSLGSLDAASGALYAVNRATGAATSLSGSGLPYGAGPIHFGVDGALAFAPAGPDTDGDGIEDASDNCTLVANPTQCDSDGDGYGNACDGDLNNNTFTNGQDTTLFRLQLGRPSVGPAYNQADLNCNGFVNGQDTVLFRQLLGKPPGPSALVP